jgi:hypothetical protein
VVVSIVDTIVVVLSAAVLRLLYRLLRRSDVRNTRCALLERGITGAP